jgi:hypothetical protein
MPSADDFFAALPGAVLRSSQPHEPVTSGSVRLDARTSVPVDVSVTQEDVSSWVAVVEAGSAGERWTGCTARVSLVVQGPGDRVPAGDTAEALAARAVIETRASEEAVDAGAARRLELHLATTVEQALRNLEARLAGPDLSSLAQAGCASPVASTDGRSDERGARDTRSLPSRSWVEPVKAAGIAAVVCLGVAFLSRIRARRRGVN